MNGKFFNAGIALLKLRQGSFERLATSGITLALLVSLSTAVGGDLRNVSLQIVRTNVHTAQITWRSQSAVPPPGLPVFPEYQVEKSQDLEHWTALGERLPGSSNGRPQTLRAPDLDTTGSRAFYRIQSIIDRPFADFNRAQLGGGDLAFANFFGAQFFGANLTNSSLVGAILSGADLRLADVGQSDLQGADLFAAKLFETSLEFSRLNHADLSFADLEAADLFLADLTGADLRSAILTDADLRLVPLNQSQMDANTRINAKWRLVWQLVNGQATTHVFTNADLGAASLRGADFHGANLSDAILDLSDLSSADLRGANLRGASLPFVQLAGALMDTNTIIEPKTRLTWELLNLDARGRDLHGVDLSVTFLGNADLRTANLTNAILSLAELFRANLGGANLRSADLSGADLFQGILTNANLSFANFASADLTLANLFGATTTGTIFTGATFFQTIMPDGTIRSR